QPFDACVTDPPEGADRLRPRVSLGLAVTGPTRQGRRRLWREIKRTLRLVLSWAAFRHPLSAHGHTLTGATPLSRVDSMTRAAVAQDPWWESLAFRSMLGVVVVPAWFVFTNLFVALTPSVRSGSLTAPGVYWWCVPGIVLFALFAWSTL